MEQILRQELRREFHRVFRAYALDRATLNAEQLLLGRLLHEHVEWHGLFGASEPRQVDVPDAVNPYLHISLHVAVEQQLEANDPPEVRTTLEQLVRTGVDPHAARHHVMSALADEIAEITSTGTSFNRTRFATRLRAALR